MGHFGYEMLELLKMLMVIQCLCLVQLALLKGTKMGSVQGLLYRVAMLPVVPNKAFSFKRLNLHLSTLF